MADIVPGLGICAVNKIAGQPDEVIARGFSSYDQAYTWLHGALHGAHQALESLKEANAANQAELNKADDQSGE